MDSDYNLISEDASSKRSHEKLVHTSFTHQQQEHGATCGNTEDARSSTTMDPSMGTSLKGSILKVVDHKPAICNGERLSSNVEASVNDVTKRSNRVTFSEEEDHGERILG